jgi:hypothetical protein
LHLFLFASLSLCISFSLHQGCQRSVISVAGAAWDATAPHGGGYLLGTRRDEVEASWAWTDLSELGPSAAIALIECDGRNWTEIANESPWMP